ncbi:uncharacterized protein LOC134846313 [Symsagittifera roscoffensis]|uniref:uncharacterized protein LOC134846313 n=1 Tax=Symsagittifera roscoffensis TaxID=84072 RepID=UPI00307B79BB
MSSLPKPQLKGLFWRHYKLVWFGALAAGASSSACYYYYMTYIRDRYKLYKRDQIIWDAVAAEIHTKPRWEDDWENAVKKTFKTSENKNLGLNKYDRCLEDAEQNYFDKYDLPEKYQYKGLHLTSAAKSVKPWQWG